MTDLTRMLSARRRHRRDSAVHDLHATLLHLLGLAHTRPTYRYNAGDFRLTDVHGEVVRGILA